MKLTNVRRGAGRPILLHFDLDFADGDVRIVNCYLKRNGAGELRVYAPSPGDKRVVTFSKSFADQIIAAAEAALQERVAHDIDTQAA